MIDLVKNMSCGREKVQQRHARQLWLILQFTAKSLYSDCDLKKYAHNLLAPILDPVFILLPKKSLNVLQTPHNSSTEMRLLCRARKDRGLHRVYRMGKKRT